MLKSFIKRSLYQLPWSMYGALHFSGRRRIIVLVYHRVLPEPYLPADHPNASLVVSAKRFEEQISFFADRNMILPLEESVRWLNDEESSPGLRVAITFDDGYFDNLEYALPILEKYKAPATLFVTTSFPDRTAELWWYEAEELLRSRRGESRIVIADPAGRPCELSVASEPDIMESFVRWRRMFLGANTREKARMLEELRNGASPVSSDHLFLTWEQLRFLASHPLITIGNHTKHHRSLSTLTPEEVIEEVELGRTKIRSELGIDVSQFAYPYGERSEAFHREYDLLRNSGHTLAVTTVPGSMFPGDDSFAIPRMQPGERHTASRLSKLISGLMDVTGRVV